MPFNRNQIKSNYKLKFNQQDVFDVDLSSTIYHDSDNSNNFIFNIDNYYIDNYPFKFLSFNDGLGARNMLRLNALTGGIGLKALNVSSSTQENVTPTKGSMLYDEVRNGFFIYK